MVMRPSVLTRLLRYIFRNNIDEEITIVRKTGRDNEA